MDHNDSPMSGKSKKKGSVGGGGGGEDKSTTSRPHTGASGAKVRVAPWLKRRAAVPALSTLRESEWSCRSAGGPGVEQAVR